MSDSKMVESMFKVVKYDGRTFVAPTNGGAAELLKDLPKTAVPSGVMITLIPGIGEEHYAGPQDGEYYTEEKACDIPALDIGTTPVKKVKGELGKFIKGIPEKEFGSWGKYPSSCPYYTY